MRYEILLTRKAVKELEGLEPQLRNRFLKELFALRDYGFSSRLDIKKLRGYRNLYRLRIGKYRVLFELEKPRRIIVRALLSLFRLYSLHGQVVLSIYRRDGLEAAYWSTKSFV